MFTRAFSFLPELTVLSVSSHLVKLLSLMALFKEGLLWEPLYDIIYVVKAPQNKSFQEHLGEVRFIFGSKGVIGFFILVIFEKMQICPVLLFESVTDFDGGVAACIYVMFVCFFFINVHFRTTVSNHCEIFSLHAGSIFPPSELYI